MIATSVFCFVFMVVTPLEYSHLGTISSAPKKVRFFVSSLLGLVVAGISGTLCLYCR